MSIITHLRQTIGQIEQFQKKCLTISCPDVHDNKGFDSCHDSKQNGKLQDEESMHQQSRKERSDLSEGDVLPLGVLTCDSVLGGGLLRRALHEICPSRPIEMGAATGFSAAIAARLLHLDGDLNGPIVWIQCQRGMRDYGRLYGMGLEEIGISLKSLLIIRVAKPRDVFWAMEEALTLGIPLAIGETDARWATLTATRRLSLAAKTGGSTGLLLHQHPFSAPSAALTRWQINSAPSKADRYGGLGLPAFSLTLTKNRRGTCGRWLAYWHHHDHIFLTPEQLTAELGKQTVSRGLLPLSGDRPDRAKLAGFSPSIQTIGDYSLAS